MAEVIKNNLELRGRKVRLEEKNGKEVWIFWDNCSNVYRVAEMELK